jgi:hypothetical protein
MLAGAYVDLWMQAGHVFSAGADNSVLMWDLASQSKVVVGQVGAPAHIPP